jgi:SAM-dependent methyltransferase
VAWPWEIVERDHELQNPTSAEKIRLLGDYARLGAGSRVLDLACGKCGPAIVLASTYGCRIVGVELREGFADEGRARVEAAGLEHLIEVQTGDAAEFPLEPEWDAVLCLGASFAWGTMAEAAPALTAGVRSGGYLAIGEPYWWQWPLPPAVADDGYVDLAGTVERFEAAGVATTGLIASSDDDWDRYESLHWRAVEEWLAENPGHPDAAEIRQRHGRYRADYIGASRALLGWAIFVGRKP